MRKNRGQRALEYERGAKSTKPSSNAVRFAFRSALLLAWLTSLSALAQDIHFSQYFNAPLALGPGSIGQFDGDQRFNGIFRQQWRSVTIPYRTFGLGWELRDIGRSDKLAIGIWAMNDKAGDSRMTQFQFLGGASWTERWGDLRQHSISGGVQFGFTSLTIDPGALTFDAQYNGYYFDPQLANGESFQRDGLIHPDLHAGATYRYTPRHRHLLQVGLSFFNLTTPNIGFLGGPGVPLDGRSSSHILGQFPVSERVELLPMAQWMSQGEFNEFIIGSNVRYILLDRYGLERAVILGLHGRAADAGYIHAGFQYDDWTVGLSYDINTSDLVPASRNRGGIEFAVIRILKKRPILPVRFKACPEQL